MTSAEFFKKVKNLPLAKRMVILDSNKLGTMTLNDVQAQMSRFGREREIIKMQEDNLLAKVEKFL